MSTFEARYEGGRSCTVLSTSCLTTLPGAKAGKGLVFTGNSVP